MSKKILVFAVLFSLVISMALTQEANARTRGAGQHSHTTASLDPSRVCGIHICQQGENTKWSSAVLASQREGPGKATGGQHGNIIMHQVVVNSWMKSMSSEQVMISNPTVDDQTHQMTMPKIMPPTQQNNTNSKMSNNSSSTMPANHSNSTTHTNSTNKNSTGSQ
jgi:hypothetical protein